MSLLSHSTDHLNVLYQTDDNYAPYCGVSMTSLFANNKDIETIAVYVIDDGISDENKQKMLDLANQYKRKVHFMDLQFAVDELRAINAPTYRGSYAPYLRMFAFALLPDSVNKVLYIDSDTVVVDSLKEIAPPRSICKATSLAWYAMDSALDTNSPMA